MDKQPLWSTPAKPTCFLQLWIGKILPRRTEKQLIYCAQFRSHTISCYSEREIIRAIGHSQLWGIEHIKMLQDLTAAYTISRRWEILLVGGEISSGKMSGIQLLVPIWVMMQEQYHIGRFMHCKRYPIITNPDPSTIDCRSIYVWSKCSVIILRDRLLQCWGFSS